MNAAKLLLIQTECTLFFEENRFAIETERGLAMRLGRKAEDLAIVLEMLTAKSILQKSGEGEFTYYRYQLPKHSEELVSWNEE